MQTASDKAAAAAASTLLSLAEAIVLYSMVFKKQVGAVASHSPTSLLMNEADW